jgi:hypothetical protein
MRRIWSIEVSAGALAEMSKYSGEASKEPVHPEGRAGFGCTGEAVEAESELLRAGKLVGERDVTPESLVRGDEQAASGGTGVVGADRRVDIAGVKGDIVVLRRAGLAWPDRSDVESERGGGWVRSGRRRRRRRGGRRWRGFGAWKVTQRRRMARRRDRSGGSFGLSFESSNFQMTRLLIEILFARTCSSCRAEDWAFPRQ